MTDHNHKNYSSADIKRYVNGQMSAEEMNAFEKSALEDPFLSDAVDGYMEAGTGKVDEGLEALQVRLENRIKKEDKRPAFPLSSWWKIAALFILIAGGGSLYYTLNNTSEQENTTIARNESAPLPPPLADSLSDDIISLNEPAPAPGTEPPLMAKASDESNRQQVPAKTSREEVATSESQAKMPAPGKPQFPAPALMKRNKDANVPSPEAKKESAEVNQIITAQTPQEVMNVNNFRGRVVNDSNQPVAGASVMVLNSQLGLSTDTNGYFDFSFVDTTARIAISTPGYSPARATIKNNVAINEIKLRQSNPQLEKEMASRSSGSIRKSIPVVTGANASGQSVEPVTGWSAFESYLEKNRVIPANLRNVHGETMLSFIVDSSGRPSQIIVEKSLNSGLDQEAIRLVKEGPSWNVKNAADAKGSVTIRF